MPKLTNMYLLLVLLPLCAQLSLCCPSSSEENEDNVITRPHINRKGQKGSSCIPECEKGFQCQVIGPLADFDLTWVVNS